MPVCPPADVRGRPGRRGQLLFVCKPASHKTLAEYLNGVELDSLRVTTGRGADRRIHRYRWMNAVPLREGKDALAVNWLAIEIAKPDGKGGVRSSV